MFAFNEDVILAFFPPIELTTEIFTPTNAHLPTVDSSVLIYLN